MVIIISEFGIKIKNISAGTLYDVNLGTRDYFSYTEAMLNNSLFSAFLIKNGLNVYKGESTRDIICLDFDFGTRSYEDEHKRIEQLYKNSDGELKERLKYTLEKVENNKDLYDEKKREQILPCDYWFHFIVKKNGKRYKRKIWGVTRTQSSYNSGLWTDK